MCFRSGHRCALELPLSPAHRVERALCEDHPRYSADRLALRSEHRALFPFHRHHLEIHGFHFILYLAGLQSIPEELEESAKLDGASNLRVIRDITIPLLGPTVRLTIFLSAIGSCNFST